MLSSQYQTLTRDILLSLEADWKKLAHNAVEKNLFAYPIFVASSLDLLAPLQPRLLTIRSHDMLIGLVIVRGDWGYAKLPVPFLRTALHHEQYLGTPLVRHGFEKEFARGLCNWLDTAPPNCCFLNLALISADGKVAEALASYTKADDRPLLATNALKRAAITPKAVTEQVAELSLTPSRRKSIRKARKKLAEQGRVEIERLSDESELENWLSGFLAMEDTGWKQENGSSILSCEKETALYRSIVRSAFASGNLHFTRMCLDTRPIAYTLDIAAPPMVYCLKSAIDQDYRKFSPGILMEIETLAFYRGKTELSLVDSCTSPENAMLNELWPDRKLITDLILSRKGWPYRMIFQAIRKIKTAAGLNAEQPA